MSISDDLPRSAHWPLSLEDKPGLQSAGREGGCHMLQYMKAVWNCFQRLARGCEETPVVGDVKLHQKNHVFQKKLLINSLLDI